MIKNHKKEIQKIVPAERFFYLALYGSQNYDMAGPESDVDTKAIIMPSLGDIVLNKKPTSYTHVLDNGENLDIKDVRIMFDCYRKQNVNYVETLFTEYYDYGALYEKEVKELRDNAELIARYNPYLAVKCIKGMSYEKYHALTHKYPSKIKIIEKYGYDPKQLSHIVRLQDLLIKYVNECPYALCLKPVQSDFIYDIKVNGYGSLEKAQELAEVTLARTEEIADNFCNKIENKPNLKAKKILDEIQYETIRKAIRIEVF